MMEWYYPWAKFRAQTAAGVWWEYQRMPVRGHLNWRSNGGLAKRVDMSPQPPGFCSELEIRDE